MRQLPLLLATFTLIALAGCAGDKSPAASPGNLTTLPRPSEIDAPVEPRTASGSLSEVTRFIYHRGDQFLPFPGLSHNAFADAGTQSARIMGSTSELNYCYYRINNFILDETETLEELSFDVDWPTGPPAASEGLWIGVPDLTADAWVWHGPLGEGRTTLDLRSGDFHGHDPSGSAALYIAVVNFSGGEANLRSMSAQYAHADSVDGDEWIYFETHDSGDLVDYNGISRVPAAGGPVETIFFADSERHYSRPQIVWHEDRWRLVYAYKTITPAWETWIAELDGSDEARYRFGATDFLTAGWRYPGNKELWLQKNGGGTLNIYAAEEGGDSGRLSDSPINVLDAVWYEHGDAMTTFGALAAIELDATHSLLAIVAANTLPSPFGFTNLYDLMPGESAFDPHILEGSDGPGNPLYHTYFSARGRDDASANLYLHDYDNLSADHVVPVLIDPALDLVSPATSPTGLHLAYVAKAVDANSGALYVTVPGAPQPPGALTPLVDDDVVGNLAWYDPTP
jgi:hypothetical protein